MRKIKQLSEDINITVNNADGALSNTETDHYRQCYGELLKKAEREDVYGLKSQSTNNADK